MHPNKPPPPRVVPGQPNRPPGGMRAKQRRGDLQLPLCTCSKTGQEKLSRPWDDFWRWPSSDRQARWQKLGRGGAQGYLPSPMSLVHGPSSVKQAEGPTSGGEGWFRFRPAPPLPPCRWPRQVKQAERPTSEVAKIRPTAEGGHRLPSCILHHKEGATTS